MKAIIDVSNSGTEFLPITKSIPIEMLPLIDKPIIEFIIKELLESGIKDILIASDINKKILEDYFDREIELETLFKKENNKSKLDKIKLGFEDVNIHSQRINRRKNSSHPIHQVKPFIDNQPFIYIQPYYIITNSSLTIKKMIETYSKTNLNIIALTSKNLNKKNKFQFILNNKTKANEQFIKEILSNHSPDYQKDSFTSIKRYLFNPDIINYLSNSDYGFLDIDEILFLKRGDFSLENSFTTEIINDDVLDVSNLFEYIKSYTKYALTREEYKDEFEKYLRKIIDE